MRRERKKRRKVKRTREQEKHQREYKPTLRLFN